MTTLLALYRRPDGGPEALATFERRYAAVLAEAARDLGIAKDGRPRPEVLIPPRAHQQPLGPELRHGAHRCGRRSSASGLPSSPVRPPGGHAPNQLSRAPSIVRIAPER